MKISREHLIEELAHYKAEVRELRSIRNRLEVELSKTKDELEDWKAACKVADASADRFYLELKGEL